MNFVYLVFLILAWVEIECLIGGTRLIYSLPGYAVLAIGALLTLAGIRQKRIPPDALSLGATLLLGAWIVIRAMHSPVEYLALPDFFMMIACLMTYLLAAFYLTGAREQTVMIVVIWLVAALEVWVGMIQFLNNPKFMLFGLLRPDDTRASGMYISPNNFAGFLMMVAVLSISLAVWSSWRVWAKILAVYIAFCCLVGVAISGSRGGYFATIGSLLSFAIGSIYAIRVADPRRFLPVALGSLGGLAAIVALAAFLMAHSEFLTHRMQTMVYKDPRIYNWEAAIDHIRLSPWVGTGSGTHLIYGRLFRRPQIQANPVHAHCDYLELLAEYGCVGGVCMAFFLAAHARNAFRSYSDILRREVLPSGLMQSDSFAIQLGALCAVAGLAIHSLVDFDMHVPGNALIFAFLFGLLASPGIERPLGLMDRRFTPWARPLLPALGLLMLFRGLPMLPSEFCSEIARRCLRDHLFKESVSYAEKGLGTTGLPGNSNRAADPDILDKLLAKAGPDPRSPDLWFYLGEANRMLALKMPNMYLQRDYYERAAAAFKAGLLIFPQDENMLVRYGQVLDGMGRYAEAEAIYQRALAWDPNLNTIYGYYEDHLTAEGKKEKAKALAEKRLRLAPAEMVEAEPKGDQRLQ